jgi:hypothetical protein
MATRSDDALRLDVVYYSSPIPRNLGVLVNAKGSVEAVVLRLLVLDVVPGRHAGQPLRRQLTRLQSHWPPSLRPTQWRLGCGRGFSHTIVPAPGKGRRFAKGIHAAWRRWLRLRLRDPDAEGGSAN